MKVFKQVLVFGKLYKFLFATGNLRFETALGWREIALLGLCRPLQLLSGCRNDGEKGIFNRAPNLYCQL